VRHAQTSSKLVSYTQAAEAATNHENDYEPRRTALSLEYEATEGKRRRANPEAQRKQQKCDIHKQKQQARLVHTHTDQELPANQQQAAPSTEVRTQEEELST